MSRQALLPQRDTAWRFTKNSRGGSDSQPFTPTLHCPLNLSYWRAESRHRRSTHLVKPPLALVALVALPHLAVLQRFGSVFDHPFASTMETIHIYYLSPGQKA